MVDCRFDWFVSGFLGVGCGVLGFWVCYRFCLLWVVCADCLICCFLLCWVGWLWVCCFVCGWRYVGGLNGCAVGVCLVFAWLFLCWGWLCHWYFAGLGWLLLGFGVVTLIVACVVLFG